MQIINEKYLHLILTDKTRDLILAMIAGKTIKSITLMAGLKHQHNRSKDVTLYNVTGHRLKITTTTGNIDNPIPTDYIDINVDWAVNKRSAFTNGFYLCWVLSYEIDGVDDTRFGLYSDMFTNNLLVQN